MAAFYGSLEDIWTKTTRENALIVERTFRNGLMIISFITGISIAVMGPITTLANAIVIAAVWKDPLKQLRSSPSNIIIESMAVCDLLVGSVCSVFQAFSFISLVLSNEEAATVTSVTISLTALLIEVSVFHVLALTIDRVIAVVDPLLYKSRVTRKRVLVSVSLIWVFCLLFALLQIPLSGNFYIHYLMEMVVVTLTGLAILSLSVCIVIFVRRQKEKLRNIKELNKNLSTRAYLEKDRKTTKTVIVILAFFTLCFLPFFITWTILAACSACKPKLNLILTFHCLFIILTNVNSCINPFIYAFRLPKFRKPVDLMTKRLLLCRKSSSSEQINDTSTRNEDCGSNDLKLSVEDQTKINTKL